ncbi:MAG: hypothetical protein Q6K80_11340, partial [Thermostichus sp. DG_1_6_bins_120]
MSRFSQKKLGRLGGPVRMTLGVGNAEGKSSPFRSVMGWAGSGLTQACLDRYKHLLRTGSDPGRILFLVRSQRQAREVL